MKLPILASVALSCACAAATAAPVVPLKDQPVYWGVGYSWVNYTETGIGDEASLGAVVGRLGYQFTDMISAEARYGRGVRAADLAATEVELDQVYGLYGKVNLLTDIDFTPYLILGYTQAEASSAARSNDENDFSYGVGIDFCSDQPVCMHAEYTSYLAKDEFDAAGMMLGLRVNF